MRYTVEVSWEKNFQVKWTSLVAYWKRCQRHRGNHERMHSISTYAGMHTFTHRHPVPYSSLSAPSLSLYRSFSFSLSISLASVHSDSHFARSDGELGDNICSLDYGAIKEDRHAGKGTARLSHRLRGNQSLSKLHTSPLYLQASEEWTNANLKTRCPAENRKDTLRFASSVNIIPFHL